jgi:probable HAF family extracellular repeat protein
MKRFAICCLGLAVLVCLSMPSGMAQDTGAATDPSTTYTFQTVNYPGDNFTQLLGVNDSKVIAGYHGSGQTGHPNKGFVLTLPKTFTSENFPGSVQTQVTGINNHNTTSGFYIDTKMINHGFYELNADGTFTTVDFPGTTFNQLLGVSLQAQFAGFYQDSAGNAHAYTFGRVGGVFSVFTIPNATAATATSVNNTGEVSGFYADTSGVHGFILNLGTFTPLNYPGAAATSALGLNNKGEVVGTYTASSGEVHGFVYEGGKFQSVDDPDGIGETMINGVNDNGVIVGFYGSCTIGAFVCNGFVGTP